MNANLTPAQIKDIMKIARGNVKAASNEATASLPDTNGEVKVNTNAKGEEPGIAAQKPENPATSSVGVQSSVTESNEVGTAAPSAMSADPTEQAISQTNALKAKVANVLRVVSGKPAPAVTPPAGAAPIAASADVTTKVSTADIEKVAAVLSTNEGRRFVHAQLMTQLGAEAADEMIKRASEYVIQHDDAANAEAEQQKVAAEIMEAYQALPEHERIIAIKTAAVMEKLASGASADELTYIQVGHAAAVDYLQTCRPVRKTAGEMPPEAGGMPPEGAPIDEASGEMPSDQPPAEGSQPQLEEIVAALEQLVQSGQCTPEQAQQIMQALMEGSPEGTAAEAAPAEADAMTKSASAMVDAILKTIAA